MMAVEEGSGLLDHDKKANIIERCLDSTSYHKLVVLTVCLALGNAGILLSFYTIDY
jgi:hypothetical protein